MGEEEILETISVENAKKDANNHQNMQKPTAEYRQVLNKSKANLLVKSLFKQVNEQHQTESKFLLKQGFYRLLELKKR